MSTAMVEVKPALASRLISEGSVNQKLLKLSIEAHNFAAFASAGSSVPCSP
jgi:hypothetical protein